MSTARTKGSLPPSWIGHS